MSVDPVDDDQSVLRFHHVVAIHILGQVRVLEWERMRSHGDAELGPSSQAGRTGIGGRYANTELAGVANQRSPRKNPRLSIEYKPFWQGRAVRLCGGIGQRLARIGIDERVGSQCEAEPTVRRSRLVRDRLGYLGRLIYVVDGHARFSRVAFESVVVAHAKANRPGPRTREPGGEGRGHAHFVAACGGSARLAVVPVPVQVPLVGDHCVRGVRIHGTRTVQRHCAAFVDRIGAARVCDRPLVDGDRSIHDDGSHPGEVGGAVERVTHDQVPRSAGAIHRVDRDIPNDPVRVDGLGGIGVGPVPSDPVQHVVIPRPGALAVEDRALEDF